MGMRHDAREWALQFLFQSEFNQEESLERGFKLFWQQIGETSPAEGKEQPCPSTKARLFTEELVRGVIAHHPDIDPLIAQYAEHWGIERMGTVDRNAMRIAVFEMLYRDDIPPIVSINEAVELAKSYSTIESGKFVNGILDRIRKGLDCPARDAKTPKPASHSEVSKDSEVKDDSPAPEE